MPDRESYYALTDSHSHSAIDVEHWVWLNITAPAQSNSSAISVREYYVPETVVRYIPSYKIQLVGQLASIKGDDEPVIVDQTARDPKLVGKALRFLASGYLSPLDAASSPACKHSLGELVALYKFSTGMSIKRLETAILHHIDTFEDLSLAFFLAFARSYYSAHGDEAKDTSLGDLIKKKLGEFLPLMIELGAVDEIKNEGGILGRQLIEVLLDERAAVKARQKRSSSDSAIKIEDD